MLEDLCKVESNTTAKSLLRYEILQSCSLDTWCKFVLKSKSLSPPPPLLGVFNDFLYGGPPYTSRVHCCNERNHNPVCKACFEIISSKTVWIEVHNDSFLFMDMKLFGDLTGISKSIHCQLFDPELWLNYLYEQIVGGAPKSLTKCQ